MQRVSSHHLPILSLSAPKVVFLKFRTTFSSFAAFLNTTPHTKFHSASIDTNLNKIRQRTRRLGYHFLLAPSRFFANLLKFTFLNFRDVSERLGWFFPDPGNGEKLAGIFFKKMKSIPPLELFWEPKQKKRYFIIYIDLQIKARETQKLKEK